MPRMDGRVLNKGSKRMSNFHSVSPGGGQQGDPLGMKLLGPEGIYILPPQRCSLRRREFFLRANRILGSYTTLAIYSDFGRQWGEFQAKKGVFGDKTPMRFTINERTMQTSYRKFKEIYQKALPQLTNYIFLMIYGNFESFFADLVIDGLLEQNHPNPKEETIRLMMATKWVGKIDRISQKFGLDLGKRARDEHFQELHMEITGNVYKDPIEFLQKMADIRHRLVHYSGQVDALLIKDVPNYGLSVGDLIELPGQLPYDVNNYFVMLTEMIDEAFSNQFGWSRVLIPPEQLVE